MRNSKYERVYDKGEVKPSYIEGRHYKEWWWGSKHLKH